MFALREIIMILGMACTILPLLAMPPMLVIGIVMFKKRMVKELDHLDQYRSTISPSICASADNYFLPY